MKKRGFTLIELLAVVIILAILMIIAVPNILNTLNKSKEEANKQNVDQYVEAIKHTVLKNELNNDPILPGKYTTNENGVLENILEPENTIEVDYTGKEVCCDTVQISNNGDVFVENCTVGKTKLGDYSSGTKYLSDSILLEAKEKGYYYTTVPDFSKVTTDGEYGLYSMQDDLGISYYFRGDVENNYVEFGQMENVFYIPKDINETALESAIGTEHLGTYKLYVRQMVFSSENECVSFGKNMGGIWNTCDELLNVSEVFVSNTYAESAIGMWGTLSENSCVAVMQTLGIEVTSCTKKEISKQSSMYWRIVRINGDGSIRLIYDGIELVDNDKFNYASIGKSIFNDDSSKIGYTYYENGTLKNSIMKTYLESWYENTLEEKYGIYIADAIFCHDMSNRLQNGLFVEFDSVQRLYSRKEPKLICEQENDRYTVSNSSGNSLLSKPIGLITADELALSGGVAGDGYTPTYYTYSNQWQWTFTPAKTETFLDSNGEVLYVMMGVSSGGTFGDGSDGILEYENHVRPVINLKKGVKFTGTGTINNPYVILTD